MSLFYHKKNSQGLIIENTTKEFKSYSMVDY